MRSLWDLDFSAGLHPVFNFQNRGTCACFMQMDVISDSDNPCLECLKCVLSDSRIETFKWVEFLS